MTSAPAKRQADIVVESANRYFVARKRQYIAWTLRGHGHAVAVLESLAALKLAQMKWGENAGVRPLGNGLWAVRFANANTDTEATETRRGHRGVSDGAIAPQCNCSVPSSSSVVSVSALEVAV